MCSCKKNTSTRSSGPSHHQDEHTISARGCALQLFHAHHLVSAVSQASNVQPGLAISTDLASLSSTAPFLPAQVGCPHKGDSLNIYLMSLPPLACPSSNSLSLAASRSFARSAQTRLAAAPKGDALNIYLVIMRHSASHNQSLALLQTRHRSHPSILCQDFQAPRLPFHHRLAAPPRATRSTSTSCACGNRAGTWSPPYAASRSAGATWTLTCRVSST